MKRKDKYYRLNPYYDEMTIDEWLGCKDHYFNLWQGSTLKTLCNINLQPKRRHFRSITKKISVYLLGEDYEHLKNRSYMRKTKKRVYSRPQAFLRLQDRRTYGLA